MESDIVGNDEIIREIDSPDNGREPGANTENQEENSSGPLVEFSHKMWRNYKRFTEMPSGSKGVFKISGKISYLISIAITLWLVYFIYQETGKSVLIKYKTAAGSFLVAEPHRYPDVILCPSYEKNLSSPTAEYAVFYSLTIPGLLGIEPSEMNELAEMFYNSCPTNAECKEITGRCDGKWAEYCREMDDLVLAAKKWADDGNKWSIFPGYPTSVYGWYHGYSNLFTGTTLSLLEALYWEREANQGWTLHMLWSAIISPRYLHTQLSRKFNSSLGVTDSVFDAFLMHGEDQYPNQALETVWVGKSLCALLLGSQMPLITSGYSGFWVPYGTNEGYPLHSKPPYRYWIGNLDTTEVRESAMLTNEEQKSKGVSYIIQPKVSGVIQYQVMKVKDESGKATSCAAQNVIKGTRIPCRHLEDGIIWYYDLHFEGRPWPAVWIYAKTMHTIDRTLRYSEYSRLQLAAGCLGLVVGFSIMQLIELVTAQLKAKKILRRITINVIEVICLILLVLATVLLTQRDISEYVQDRYHPVFQNQELTNIVPVVRLCSEDTRFLLGKRVLPVNVTKMYEYGVSENLYAFWQFALWQAEEPSLPRPFREKLNETGVYVRDRWMFEKWLFDEDVHFYCRPEIVEFPRDEEKCNARFKFFNPLKGMLYSGRKEKVELKKATRAMKVLENESKVLARKIGLSSERLEIIDFKEFFSMDRVIKRCTLWGKDVPDCGKKYSSFELDGQVNAYCLTVDIDRSEIDWEAKLGFQNGLEIVLDSEAMFRDGDVQSYFAPGSPHQNFPFVATVSHFSAFILSNTSGNHTLHDSWHGGRKYYRPFSGEYPYDKVSVLHPIWHNDDVEVPVAWNSFERRGYGYNVEVRQSFNQIIERNDEKGRKICTSVDDATCRFPRSETRILTRALVAQDKCGCLMCVKNDVKSMENLEIVLGEPPKCCTVREIFSCQEMLLQRVSWNETAQEYDSTDPKHLNDLQSLNSVHLGSDQLVGTMNHLLGKNRDELASELFMLERLKLDSLSNETIDRLIEFLVNCFTPVCDKKNHRIGGITRNLEKTEEESVYRIFFSTNEAIGLSEVDRLDATQIFAVIVCGYGVTFGLSFLGIGELLLLAARKIKGKLTLTFSKVAHQHLLRCIGVLVDTEAIYEYDENRSGPAADNNKIVPYSETNNLKPRNANAEKEEESERERELKKQSLFMLPLLIALSISVFVVTWFFFFKYGNQMNDLSVTDSPIYQRPSILICTTDTENFNTLQNLIAEANCSASGNEKEPCAKHFKTYVRYHEDRLCLMKDNSHSLSKLDATTADLVLEYDLKTPKPPITLWAGSLNETRSELIYPFKKWDKANLFLAYQIKQMKTYRSCVDSLQPVACPECEADLKTRGVPHVCCFGKNSAAPKLTSEKVCQTTRFDNSFMASDTAQAGKGMLTVTAGSSIVVMNEERILYGWSMLFSIVGGYISSFIDLSVLNIICALLFPTIKMIISLTSDGNGSPEKNKGNREVVEEEAVVPAE